MLKRLLIAWKLMPQSQDTGQMQPQCPVCQNTQNLFCHTTYQDIANVTRFQFSSQACKHIWEVCFQVSGGHMFSWTETLEATAGDIWNDTPEAPSLAATAESQHPMSPLTKALEARRQRLQGEDFETWFQCAMGENQAGLGS